MSRGFAGVSRAVGVLAVTTGLLGAGAFVVAQPGQPPDETTTRPRPAAAGQPPTGRASSDGRNINIQLGNSKRTLYILIDVKNNRTIGQILDTLEIGATKTVPPCTFDKPISYRPLPPAFVRQFGALTGTVQANQQVAANESNTHFTEVSYEPPVWQIDVDPNKRIESLEVKYQSGKSATFKPDVTGARDAPLTLLFRGRYALRLDDKEVPESYSMTLRNTFSGDTSPQTESSKPWPQGERSYLIALTNFKGDYQQLFKVIRRQRGGPNFVASPFDYVNLDQELTFSQVTLGGTPPRRGVSYDNLLHRYTPTVDALSGETVARVWMKFPLTAEEAQAELATLRALKDPYKSLPEQIRQENPSWAASKQMPVVAGGTELKPRWYELPDVASPPRGESFRRTIQLRNLRELQKKYPKAYRLLVWEFDDGTNRRAIFFKVTDAATKKEQEVYALGEEIEDGWQKVLVTGPGGEGADAPASPAGTKPKANDKKPPQ